MNSNELIKQKFLKNWPESFKIFEDSCKYSIDNNLDFIRGILLSRESPITYANFDSISQQLQDYLGELGYKNSIMSMNDPFYTLKGHEMGLTFTIFLSAGAIKAYIAENNKWQDWAKTSNYRTSGPQPPRPIYDSIRYLDIYKEERKKK